jgi:nicotinamidase-related amidase
MLVDRARAQLLIVDVQERLLPAMTAPDAVVAGCTRLMKAAGIMGLPLTVSEQYPKGLGPTVDAVRAELDDGAVMDKVHFACTADPAIMTRIAGAGRQQVVIAGIEAHVCVLQTAIGLKERGFAPFVVLDASSSRRPESVATARDRLLANGVEVVTGEMVLFECMHQAGTPEFKELSQLVK